MRNSLRFSLGALALAGLAACSSSSDQPALSDDLKQDLAKVGGGDVQLANAPTPRVDIISASERTESPTPAPRAKQIARVPSVVRGSRAAIKSVQHDTPAPAETQARAEEAAPIEVREAPPAPERVPAAAGRPEAPRPSTQREPPGGWSTPGRIIRNAPFPINP